MITDVFDGNIAWIMDTGSVRIHKKTDLIVKKNTNFFLKLKPTTFFIALLKVLRLINNYLIVF
jgi:hypothetical protein